MCLYCRARLLLQFSKSFTKRKGSCMLAVALFFLVFRTNATMQRAISASMEKSFLLPIAEQKQIVMLLEHEILFVLTSLLTGKCVKLPDIP